jgi:phosphoribosylpyrophosphate synthetase
VTDVPTRILLGSFSADRADQLHDLLRVARAGDADAMSAILDRLRSAAPSVWPGIDGAVVLAVPGHLPGPANPLVLAVADDLAAARGWDHRRDALRRVRPSPQAKSGAARDAAAEAETLVWVPAPGGTAIVLIDDVIRTGATLAACATAIRAAGDPRQVVAIVLAARRTGSVE